MGDALATKFMYLNLHIGVMFLDCPKFLTFDIK